MGVTGSTRARPSHLVRVELPAGRFGRLGEDGAGGIGEGEDPARDGHEPREEVREWDVLLGDVQHERRGVVHPKDPRQHRRGDRVVLGTSMFIVIL